MPRLATYNQGCQFCGEPVVAGKDYVDDIDGLGLCHANGRCNVNQPSPLRPEGAPPCPKCDAKMAIRTNGKTHVKFWGCPNFPRGCRGTRDMNPAPAQLPSPCLYQTTQLTSPLHTNHYPSGAMVRQDASSCAASPARASLEEEVLSVRKQNELMVRQLKEEREKQAKQLEEVRAAAAQKATQELQEQQQREKDALQREYPVPEFLKKYISDSPQNSCLNIGVMGKAGTGKSALIKAMLPKLKSAGDSQSVLTSFEGDGTINPTPYTLDVFPNKVTLWDLPGQGTDKIPSKTYFRSMGLKHFDGIIVVVDGRWSESDSALLGAIRFGVPWHQIVRTKIDQAIDSGEEDEGLSQHEVLHRVRQKLCQQLDEEDPANIHLVTSRRRYWDKFGDIDDLCKNVRDFAETIESPELQLRPEDSISNVSNISCSAESVILDVAGEIGGKCFLGDTMIEMFDNHGNAHWDYARNLCKGVWVQGFYNRLQVKQVTFRKEVRTLVKLVVDETIRLTVTDNHRVVVGFEGRRSETREAKDLKPGVFIMLMRGKQRLKAVRLMEDVSVEVIEVMFKPDEPVGAFDLPKDMILSKGRRSVRRGQKVKLGEGEHSQHPECDDTASIRTYDSFEADAPSNPESIRFRQQCQ